MVGVATCSHTHSTGVQTEEEGPREPLSLAARLQVLDQHHAAQLGEEGRGGGDGVGEMVEGWKRECEEQMRRQMDREVEEFRYICGSIPYIYVVHIPVVCVRVCVYVQRA